MTSGATRGTWADLIPIAAGDRVLLTARFEDVADRFGDRGAVVAPLATDGDSASGPADVVVVEGSRRPALDEWLERVGAGGRLVVLAPNRWSPVRLFRSVGDRPKEAPPGLRATNRLLASNARIAAVHPFALFPDLDSPTSAYRLDTPPIADLVLKSATFGAGRIRRLMLWLLGRVVGSGIGWHAPPAWMLVAHVDRAPAGLIPTGRIGVAANEQGVVLLGSGPDAIEKTYRHSTNADRVSQIHGELAAAGVDIVNPVRSRPSPTRLRFDWVPGADIDEAALSDDELASWSARAAAVLGCIHSATHHDDGTVMTHGDYWLGALIARDDEIVGVIDWTDGGRARPVVDISVLTTAVNARSTLDATTRRRILDEMRRAYEAAGGPAGAFAALVVGG